VIQQRQSIAVATLRHLLFCSGGHLAAGRAAPAMRGFRDRRGADGRSEADPGSSVVLAAQTETAEHLRPRRVRT
jgi:hypothetical protein